VKHSWNTLDLNQINAILAAVDEKPLVIDANDLNNAKNVDDGGNDE
jgi:hypothetical protein